MCLKLKFKEDPDGDFSMDVPARPVSMRGLGAPPPRGPRSRRSSQVVVIDSSSLRGSGQLGRRVSISERSPRTSTQLARRVSVTERSPRTSGSLLSPRRQTIQRSPHASGHSLAVPNYIELPRADPVILPAALASPTFVERREPAPPPAPEPPRAANLGHSRSRSHSTQRARDASRPRAHSSARSPRHSDFLAPQPSPRASGASMERQASGDRHRSASRHERRTSRDRPRSTYAEEAQRLAREPSQNRQRPYYLEDGRQNEGKRLAEERVIHGDSSTTKKYYYV